MIDFSTLKGLTIPEGKVKQIADLSGRVLWSAVDNLTVTMTQANPSGVEAYISYTIGSITNISEPGIYQVPAGTEMRAYISHKGNLTDVLPYIIFNGTSVGTSGSEGSYYDPTYFADYTFTLTKDITFYVGTYGKGAYAIYINEV